MSKLATDPVLAQLIKFVESQDGMRLSVELLVNGYSLTGVLISKKEYFRHIKEGAMNEMSAREINFNEFIDDKHHGNNEKLQKAKSAFSQLFDFVHSASCEAGKAELQFVHLKSSSTGTAEAIESPLLWRLSADSIDGVSFDLSALPVII